jgi:hypothetical protein
MKRARGKTASNNMKEVKKGKRMPNKSATIPPAKGAIVEPTSQEMFVQLYAEAIVLVEETSAIIVHRIGKYKPVAKPDSKTHGTKSTQLPAKVYIRGGKIAHNVPNTCIRFLPYLSERKPLKICITAATAFEAENTSPSSIIDALRELFM